MIFIVISIRVVPEPCFSLSLSVHDGTAVRFLYLTHAQQHTSPKRGTATLILTHAEMTEKKADIRPKFTTAKEKIWIIA